MKTSTFFSFLFCAIALFACSKGGAPASAEEARELLVGKKWSVTDAGLLESPE